MSNFFFCQYGFKKLSAAEASESVYMRERDKAYHIRQPHTKLTFGDATTSKDPDPDAFALELSDQGIPSSHSSGARILVV